MIRLNNDYCFGAHENILKALEKFNAEANPGYGLDDHCAEAAENIKKVCNVPNAHVHFVTGGTQTNLLVITAALRPYQGAVCVESGHINAHETGAVENCGYKILTAPGTNGKITAQEIEKIAVDYETSPVPEHITEPKLVYISFPTETGSIYSKKELTDISNVCKNHGLYLFVDGARLCYGLAGENNDVSIEDIAALSDVFYIGGTKCGLLFGEAIVINNDELKPSFRHYIKQKGAMLAKGWLLGIQFNEMFKDGLYFKIGQNAVKQALRIKEAFKAKNIPFDSDSPTNQQFVILHDSDLEKLSKKYFYEYESRVDETHSCVRFCTSWATNDSDIDELIKDIESL